MKPKRIQRRRTKGWRMPPNTVSVTRPGRWGNPYRMGPQYLLEAGLDLRKANVGEDQETEDWLPYAYTLLLHDFRKYALNRLKAEPDWLEPLRGKNLACYCRDSDPCHADVLLEIMEEQPHTTKRLF